MINTREAIYAGLFAKLVAATGVTTSSRKLLHWDKVDRAAMPALFMVQPGETTLRGDRENMMSGLPLAWRAEVKVYVYTSVGDEDAAVPSTLMNQILDAIESVCSPTRPGERNTLGGLVSDCRINGKIETDEGTMGAQSVAIIPIEIIA